MKTSDFNSPLTSAKLNENMNKMFGVRVKLENYSREQLEDMRNKLRTRVFQQEGSAGINDLLTNETYQKDKAMLDLLNTRIKEMLGENIKQLRDKMMELSEGKKKAKPDFLDMDKDGNKKEPMKKAVADKEVKEAKKGAKPDFLDMDKDGDKKEPMKKAIKDKKVKEGFPTVDTAKAAHAEREKAKGTGKFDKKTTTTGTAYTRKSNTFDNGTEDKPKEKKVKEGSAHPKDCNCKECSGMYERDMGKHNNKTTGFKALAKKVGGGEKGQKIAGAQFQKMKKAGQLEESNFKHNVRFVNESLSFLLAEDEEAKAKAITSAGDMVNDFTSWMQRVGQYQTKTMIELADAIKADFGAQQAEAFKATVGPALSASLETLTQQREAISNAVAVLAGEATPDASMGMEPEMPMEPGMDMSAPDDMNPEPVGDEFGGADAAAGAGTTGREMRENKFARKLAESHNIMASLAK